MIFGILFRQTAEITYELYAYILNPNPARNVGTKTFLYVLVYIGEIIVIGLLSYSMRETLKTTKHVPVKTEYTDILPSDGEDKSSLYRNSSLGYQKTAEQQLIS